MNWSQDIFIKAYRFAAEAHEGQKFPGTNLPYLMHISFVSMEIIAALDIEDHHNGNLAIQCALLHDVLEDTDIAYSEIEDRFGESVAHGVLALTKDESVSRNSRMSDSLLRIMQQPNEVWMVKLADRITNLAPPPNYWTKDKKIRYKEEALEIQKSLHKASEYLGTRLMKKINEYKMYY